MSDLTERLRGTKWLNDPFPAVFWDLTQEAADALEAKDAEIARLVEIVEVHDATVRTLTNEIKRLQARVEALEKIVCSYADPTGAPDDEHDLIMSCHDWYKEELAATKQDADTDE